MADFAPTTLPGILERRQKRQAAMKLGSELVKPEVLNAISDPGFRQSMEAVGHQMAAGDLFVDDAVNFLKTVPQRQVDPAVAKYIESQLNPQAAGNIPAQAAAPPEAGTETVPPEVQNRIGPYLESYAPPGTGINLKFPPPPEVTARERAEKIKTIAEEEQTRQRLAPLTQETAQVEAFGGGAVNAIDKLLSLEDKNPGIIAKGLMPGAVPFGSKTVQSAELLLKQIRNFYTSSEAGKNMTPTEIKFVKAVLPRLLRREDINIQALKDLRSVSLKVQQRILGPTRAGESAGNAGAKKKSSFKYIGVAP